MRVDGCWKVVWGTVAPLVGCLPAALQKACRLAWEQQIIPLAEGDAQSPQHALDPRPRGDAPAFSGEAPQKFQERMPG